VVVSPEGGLNLYMMEGMLLLGFMSFILALIWHKRIRRSISFTEQLQSAFREPDISGKKQYTNCQSHQWVMKNVVIGNYSKSGESFRDLMMNRTLFGTIVLGMFLGVIPVIIVFILFKSYNIAGTSLILIFIALYILRGPGNVEVSNNLLKWLFEQDKSSLLIGDLAFARVSQRTLQGWRTKLLFIGVLSCMIAPWGEQLPVFLIWFVTQFLGWAYASIFLPLSVVSMPLAFLSYVAIGPVIFGIAGIVIRFIVNKYRSDDDVGLSVVAGGARI